MFRKKKTIAVIEIDGVISASAPKRALASKGFSLGKEVRLTVGERTFAVAVKHEVQYLRKKPHRRRVWAVCGFQRGKCWSLTEERPILVARGVNLRVGVHRHEELVTATVLFQHERRLPLQVWR